MVGGDSFLSADPRKVVITGASGNLGGKLHARLAQRRDLELIAMDAQQRDDPNIIQSDLSRFDDDWVQHFEAADAVVHLAANAAPDTSWDHLRRNNLDAVLNVFEAAAKTGVKRVIFASSCMVMEGYRGTGKPITLDLPPMPTTGYAASKLAGERIGHSFAMRHDIVVLCLRIGTIPAGANPPDICRYDWDQKRWLSDRDFCDAIECALDAEGVRFATLFVTSNNRGSPWDLSETRRLIGFDPQDSSVSSGGSTGFPLSDLIRRKTPAFLHRLIAKS